ncbi:DUF4258 domain-containing protein [Aquimarina sp. I32.4]|uniref:DUF4258 domain-containing protein n=1 Tax=Aquimarina sp. I32.4 TaxID=2053903 RepID=UPI000CDF1A5E|nr:DUF4258 domain-containing protein [Aquimarina sp. I32.4]
MKLAHRLFYYSGGFVIGLILLFFFLGGKKASCDYSPTARVLKNIRMKKKSFSQQALTTMKIHKIDTSNLREILTSGSVDFGKSNTNLDSCRTYFIEGFTKEKSFTMLVENCDSIAKVNTLNIIQ